MQSYEQLYRLYKYFKKAINTRLTPGLLREKEKLNHKLKNEIEIYLQENLHNIEDTEFHDIVKNSRFWHFEIQKLINHKLELSNLHTTVNKKTHSLSGIAKTTTAYEHTTRSTPNLTKNIKMAPFDMKQATAIVPMYDGAPDDLDAFIDAINLLAELTAAENIATAVKFVKTRLTKKARLGLPNNLANLTDIANDLKTRCKSQVKPESIIAKLKQIKKKSTTEMCDEIENLTLQLKSLYMEQQVPENVANSMATRVGLESLINGVSSQETKIILKAGNFTNIKDAILKVNENDDSQNAQVLFTNSTNQNNRQSNQSSQHNSRFTSYNNHQRGNFNTRGTRGRQYFNNGTRGFQNNNNYRPQYQRYNNYRQQRGNPAHMSNQNNPHFRRVYTGAATQLPNAPHINAFAGMQSAPQVQNMMSQPNLPGSFNGNMNHPTARTVQPMNVNGLHFLGENPNLPQFMQ